MSRNKKAVEQTTVFFLIFGLYLARKFFCYFSYSLHLIFKFRLTSKLGDLLRIVDYYLCACFDKTFSASESPTHANARQICIQCGLHVHLAVAYIHALVSFDAQSSDNLIHRIGIRLCPHVVALSHDRIEKSVEIVLCQLLHRTVHFV